MILLRQPPDIVRNEIQYHGVDETISGGQTPDIVRKEIQYNGVGETISGGLVKQYLGAIAELDSIL